MYVNFRSPSRFSLSTTVSPVLGAGLASQGTGFPSPQLIETATALDGVRFLTFAVVWVAVVCPVGAAGSVLVSHPDEIPAGLQVHVAPWDSAGMAWEGPSGTAAGSWEKAGISLGS